MEGKIAVLGDTDFVMPFSALGLDTFAVGDNPDETLEIAKKIIKGSYGLVVVSEDIAPLTEDVFSAQQNQPIPCITVVPFTAEPAGFATKTLGEALKMATGIDILK